MPHSLRLILVSEMPRRCQKPAPHYANLTGITTSSINGVDNSCDILNYGLCCNGVSTSSEPIGRSLMTMEGEKGRKVFNFDAGLRL